MTAPTPEWSRLVREQLRWWWAGHLRPRMSGLTDEEYLWEPAPGAWSVRCRGTPTPATAATAAGSGEFRPRLAPRFYRRELPLARR